MIIDNGFLRCYNTNRRYFIPFCELPFHPVSMVGQPENSPRRVWCPAKPSRQFACATSPKEVSNMSKRFTALLMALVLMVGILAIPVSAAAGVCPNCGSHSHNCKGDQTYQFSSYVPSCSWSSSPHNHFVTRVYDAYTCTNCGHYWEVVLRSPTKCPHAPTGVSFTETE